MDPNLTQNPTTPVYRRDQQTAPPEGASAGFVYTREGYPLGGIDVVMERLVELAADGIADPEVRQLAMLATQDVPSDERTGLPDRRRRNDVAASIYRTVVSNVSYTHDPYGIESMQSARATMQTLSGDCDDHSVLNAALLGAVGVPVRFVIVGTDPRAPKAFTHIYVEYESNTGEWVPFDTVPPMQRVGDAVPKSQVLIRRVYQLQQGRGGPLELSTLAGAPLTRPGQRSSALAGAGDLIATDEAWLRIVRRSHSQAPPTGQQFFIDTYVERAYVLFASCNVLVAARHAHSGEVIAAAVVQMSKWTSIWPERCEGVGRLLFPLSFDPTDTPVVIEVYDDGADVADLDASDPLGTSSSTYLTSTPVEEPDPSWWEKFSGAAGVSEAAFYAKMALWAASIGVIGFTVQPYIQRFLDEK